MATWHADFRLNDWHVSPKLNRVTHDGESVTIKHKSMAVLVFLADANGEVVTRDEIMDTIWPGMEVTDDVLTQSIVELRKAFDDDAKHPKFIETIPRIGFRLVGDIAGSQSPPPPVQIQRRYLLAVFAALIVGSIVWTLINIREGERNPVIAVTESPSIAVLAFVNLSNDPEDDYFAEGMSDEIRGLLGRIPNLKVIGRSSSHRFKGVDEDLQIIGEKLGVASVLEGTVRRSGNRVRIAPELIDTATGDVIWTDTYDRTITDVFEVQDDVAARVIAELQLRVSNNPTRGQPTDSPEAYALFLKARVLLDAQQGREAIEYLLQATEIDPNFAEVFELLAFGYWQQGGMSIPVAKSQELCFETAAKALAIDPDLTFARAMYQLASSENVSAVAALDLLEQAWREQPSNSAPFRVLIYELTYRGYLREAHRIAVQFVEIDPLSPVANYSLGESFAALGQTSEAFAPLQLSLELDNAYANWFVPAFDLSLGRDENAIAHYEANLERIGFSDTAWIKELITAARDPATGQATLDSRIPKVVAAFPEEFALDWQFNFDLWYLLFGFLDRYYEAILAAGPKVEIWSDAGVNFWHGTIFGRAEFIAHPKYLEVAELLGIIDVWEQRGPPDFCEKVAGDWVCN